MDDRGVVTLGKPGEQDYCMDNVYVHSNIMHVDVHLENEQNTVLLV